MTGRRAGLVASHLLAFAVGGALGVYAIPILVAPPPPSVPEIAAHSSRALFTGHFRRNLEDSDLFHWGEGGVAVGRDSIVLTGRRAPGPDYKLYLSPQFVETESEFARLKSRMIRVGDVRGFGALIVPVPPGTDVAAHNTVVIWCETFSQFITAAQYR